MAQGDVLLNSDGTVALNGAGLVRLVDVDSDCPDCCGGCTASGTSCTHCDDNGGFPPSQYQVTVSGFSTCPCTDWAVAVDTRFSFNTDLNGTHTLSYIGGCTWRVTHTNGINELNYSTSDGTCGGVPTSTSQDYSIDLIKTATEWRLIVYRVIAPLNIYFFDDTQNADTSGADSLCATISAAFANDYVIGGCMTEITPSVYQFAYGGSATVVCV